MDETSDDDLNFPKTEEELKSFVESVTPSRDVLMWTRLGRAKRYADASNDEALITAIDAETNAFLFFGKPDSLHAATANMRGLFTDEMVEYLQIRLETSPEPRLRARYAHVIAAYTNRHDAGLRAVEAYAAAIDYYHDVEQTSPSDALFALEALLPLTMTVGRRYRARDRIMPSVIATAKSRNPYLRKVAFELIVNDREAPVSVLAQLRADMLKTVGDLRGALDLSVIDAMAELGIRLDARLGQADHAPWQLALLDVYREVIESAAHPIMKEEAAQRAALIYQELGDDSGRAKMIDLQRSYAGQGLEYHVFSARIDESGEMADSIRVAVDTAFEEGGALRVLGWLGVSTEIVPSLQHARLALEDSAKAGTGVFSQMVTTIARAADQRVVAHGDPGEENQERSLWDQFGYGWIVTTYIMDVVARAMISNGSIGVVGFVNFLEQTWIGNAEKTQPNDLVALLAAPIRSYVGLVSHALHDDALVLTIDSLTLRFEAVLRKLARHLGEPDWIQRKDEQGRLRTQVAGLDLLKNEKLIACIGEDLHAFAIYTISQKDEKLRDKIAHGASHISDYTKENAHALIILLLRFAMLQNVHASNIRQPTE